MDKFNVKKICICLVVALCLLFAGCATRAGSGGASITPDIPVAGSAQVGGGVTLVATLFPQYDFAKSLAGDLAEVVLLLPPGAESHAFEPTPKDIVTIREADLFIYTGPEMEPWAQRIVDSLTDSGVTVADASKGVELGGETAHEHEHETHTDNTPHIAADPHIWTDPVNAKVMVENIRAGLCAVDPANTQAYAENAEAYFRKLDALDETFQSVVANGGRKDIVLGSRNPFYYFARRYGLNIHSAYDSCSAESEPSVKRVSELIEYVEVNGIPAVYHEEFIDPRVARSICDQTGAQCLLLHACHNIGKEELESGATYLSLMQQNALNLKEG